MNILHKLSTPFLCILLNFPQDIPRFMHIFPMRYFEEHPFHIPYKKYKKASRNLGTLFY